MNGALAMPSAPAASNAATALPGYDCPHCGRHVHAGALECPICQRPRFNGWVFDTD